MEPITNSKELKKAIQLLEVEQYVRGQQLKEQLFATCESFKTMNIFKSTIKKVIASSFAIDNLIGSVVSMATGYLSGKLLVGVTGKIIRKLIGSVIQIGVRNVVARPPVSIKSLGQSILQHLIHRK